MTDGGWRDRKGRPRFLGARKGVAPSAHYPFLVLSKEGLLGEHGAPFCPHSRRFCLCERRGFRICRDNLRCICSDNGYITQGPITTSVLGLGVFLVLIADYRGGVTCLYDTQLPGACLHAFESGGRSRLEAVRGMPDVPIAPPATGPPEGSGPQAQPGVGCRLCQPSLFQQGVVGAFAWGFGFLTSDFGVGRGQDLGS